MADDSIKPSQLTDEKNLFQLYRLSYKFPSSRFNLFSTIFIGLLSASYLAWGREIHAEGRLLRATINFGTTLAPSILGFLIAGFTVFVTITKPGVFSAMAKKEFKKTGQSYLKYNLSAFMLAFSHYVTYLAICTLLIYFGQPNGPITQTMKWIGKIISSEVLDGYRILASISSIIFSCWTWYLIMLLKSFIYNVYQVVVTSVRWDLEEEEKNTHKNIQRKMKRPVSRQIIN